ncbi:hypothetical protein BS78_K194100 [Paspalum vaginatum]|uniref:Uncharacterized protein n=1 Tax=Paspalum vaginatum TaxID=158149 RepID=A0A9W7XEI6_9POAL|nr:hypothetical protein BS78_K194100 [Paspalum vaginatum]
MPCMFGPGERRQGTWPLGFTPCNMTCSYRCSRRRRWRPPPHLPPPRQRAPQLQGATVQWEESLPAIPARCVLSLRRCLARGGGRPRDVPSSAVSFPSLSLPLSLSLFLLLPVPASSRPPSSVPASVGCAAAPACRRAPTRTLASASHAAAPARRPRTRLSIASAPARPAASATRPDVCTASALAASWRGDGGRWRRQRGTGPRE